MSKNKDLETILSITVGFVGLYLLFKQVHVLLLVAFGVGVLGLFSTYLREKIAWFWTKLGHILGKINGSILLSIVFFVVLFPVALLARIFGKTSFVRKQSPGNSLYFERNHLYTSADFENIW
jgi:hypothetical protein